MASKKKDFAYFAWKLKILSHKNAIKAFISGLGVKNLVNFKLFVKKRVFFSKNMVFKHFWTPISVSCGKSSQLFATKRVKPWKIWKISWFRPVSGENRTTSVGNSKEIGLFLENFWKISQKRWNLKTGNGNRSTSGEFLPLPVEKSTSASVF